MQPHQPAFLPWILAVLVPLMLYRRFRRNFGRQRLAPARRRLVIFIVLGALILTQALMLRSVPLFLGDSIGALLGAALAVWGASRTRFIEEKGQLYYVPHTYTGIAVSALFLGRLIYRFAQLYAVPGIATPGTAATPAIGDGTMPSGPAAMGQSPLTAGILFVLIGYYVCYYGLVLRKSKHIAPGDLEAPAQPAATTAEGAARAD
jgi:hypothetical protein